MSGAVWFAHLLDYDDPGPGAGAFVIFREAAVFGFGIVFILNAIFIVHAAKTGRFWPWAYVMFFLPGFGVAAYLLVELLPEYRHAPQVRKAQAKLDKAVNPGKRYRALRAALEDTDTIANRLALAQECLVLRKYDEALALYDGILQTHQGDEPVYYLGKAQAQFGLQQPKAVIATLDDLKRHWPDYQSQDGHLLYARALEGAGRDEEALHQYETLARYYAGQEVQMRRLLLLDRMGQDNEAEAIAGEIMRYYKRASKHARHQQAEWFSTAKSYLKTRPKPT